MVKFGHSSNRCISNEETVLEPNKSKDNGILLVRGTSDITLIYIGQMVDCGEIPLVCNEFSPRLL